MEVNGDQQLKVTVGLQTVFFYVQQKNEMYTIWNNLSLSK